MRINHFLITAVMVGGYIFSSCAERTVATTDDYPEGTTTEQYPASDTEVAGADTDMDRDQELGREDVLDTAEEVEMERMGTGAEDAAFAEIPAATQQLVIPMRDMMANMRQQELTGNVDQDFANLMIIHHQGAVNISNQVLQAGDNPEILDRARQTIERKQQEIELLQNFVGRQAGTTNQQMGTTGTTQENLNQQDTMGSQAAGTTNPSQQLKNVIEDTMEELRREELNGDPDHDYAHILIVHHQDAINMANVELQHGTDPQLKAIAQEIVNNNQQQIAELRTWANMNER